MKLPTLEDRLHQRVRPVDRKPSMFQKWQELLFIHWEIDPEIIQKTLPKGLYVDTFEGKTYLGLVPFYMRGIRPSFFPAVPGISNFLEVNVRTYVHDKNGVPGVWFYSLDANQRLAVKIARAFFKLPYHYAKMKASIHQENKIKYASKRVGDTKISNFEYTPKGEIFEAQPGSLHFFLAERYILFSYNPHKDQLYSGQVYHKPYPLSEAEVTNYDKHLLGLNRLDPGAKQPISYLFSKGVNVDVFSIKPVV
ncbi:YqjF family protein [Flexithrix dorotheae]|uniref:YqjF family protein n=1 Tax=Flexithrix dorotheae TaxID=70993 RepID=UPI00036E310E|nr:DUF2071 domain-containing protein [Flexithrix dorotheae]